MFQAPITWHQLSSWIVMVTRIGNPERYYPKHPCLGCCHLYYPSVRVFFLYSVSWIVMVTRIGNSAQIVSYLCLWKILSKTSHHVSEKIVVSTSHLTPDENVCILQVIFGSSWGAQCVSSTGPSSCGRLDSISGGSLEDHPVRGDHVWFPVLQCLCFLWMMTWLPASMVPSLSSGVHGSFGLQRLHSSCPGLFY